jgi:hypothetical protein
MHRLALPPTKCYQYSFLLVAKTTPRPESGRKDYAMKNCNDTIGIQTCNLPVCNKKHKQLHHKNILTYIYIYIYIYTHTHTHIESNKPFLQPGVTNQTFSLPSTFISISSHYSLLMRIIGDYFLSLHFSKPA